MSATNLIKKRTEACLNLASPALHGLSQIATQYGQESRSKRLLQIEQQLKTDVFTLLVAGRFKNGKSTFTNALLGRCTSDVPELPQGGAPLPSHDLPCTAVLTNIRFANKPSVSIRYREGYSGPREDWDFSRFINQSVVKDSKAENDAFFDNIDEFDLGLPVELCAAGIKLVDSPGLDDDFNRDLITMNAMAQSSACISLFRSDPFAGTAELNYIREMIHSGLSEVFLVVNRWNGRPVDEELKKRVWDKLVTQMLGGAAYNGQDLRANRIYFVDALQALNGKLDGDQAALETSGMAVFEEDLRLFLERDKRSAHVERFVGGATVEADEIRAEIERRRPSLQKEQMRFEAAFVAVQPRLEDVRRKRQQVPGIFETHRDRTNAKMRESLDRLEDYIYSRIDEDARSIDIPSLHKGGLGGFWEKFKAGWARKRLETEISEIMSAKVQGYLTEWQKNPSHPDGAVKIMSAAVEALKADLARSVEAINFGYEEAQMQLSGGILAGADMSGTESSMTTRVLLTAVGVFTGCPDLILSGSQKDGMKALGRNLVGQAAVLTTLLLVGAPAVVLAPAALVGGLVANMFWGASSTEKSLREAVAKTLKFGDPTQDGAGSLSRQMKVLKNSIPLGVSRLFDKVEVEAMAELTSAMDEKERSFKKQAEDSRLSAAEKAAKLSHMEADLSAIKQHVGALREARTQGNQLDMPNS